MAAWYLAIALSGAKRCWALNWVGRGAQDMLLLDGLRFSIILAVVLVVRGNRQRAGVLLIKRVRPQFALVLVSRFSSVRYSPGPVHERRHSSLLER